MTAGAAVLATLGTAMLISPSHTAKASRSISSVSHSAIFGGQIEKKDIAKILGDMSLNSNHLKLDSYAVKNEGKQLNVHFTLEKDLQERVEELYRQYDPVYAAFVAMDPETGKILAMVDYSSEPHEGNLALKATYPAASVFKVITSSAALGEGKIQPRSTIPVNGRFATLYKRNLSNTVTRFTKFITIEEAFAKSVNTAFAKIAMNRVGPDALQKYADGYGFNQHVDFDMPLDMGTVVVPKDDEFGLAESGSGYTPRQTLNPIQGAMIAAAAINGGKIPAPYVVDKVTNDDGKVVYEAEQNTDLFHPIDHETARSLSMIMEHTITGGTARKEYRDYNRHPVLSKLFMGAKTGSLSGMAPQGKYDWFVGFAQSSENPKKKITYASMIVNRKFWRVKSSHIAREVVIQYFKDGKKI